MNKTIQNGIILTGITAGLAIAPMTAQSDGSSKMSKMATKTAMMEIDKMSNEEKAAMFDKHPTQTRIWPPKWPDTI